MVEFNYSFGTRAPGRMDPEYDIPYSQKAPRIRARGNLTFLQYMDLIEFLWDKTNSEILFQPTKADKKYDPEKGYIVYSLDSKVPKDNNLKPRHQENRDHPTDPDKKLSIWTQSFQTMIAFTALHKDPRVAEETIEYFEDFMMESVPIFKELGLEEFVYARRLSDNDEKRYGEDLSARTILYMATLQKVIVVEQHKLQDVVGQVKAWFYPQES